MSDDLEELHLSQENRFIEADKSPRLSSRKKRFIEILLVLGTLFGALSWEGKVWKAITSLSAAFSIAYNAISFHHAMVVNRQDDAVAKEKTKPTEAPATAPCSEPIEKRLLDCNKRPLKN